MSDEFTPYFEDVELTPEQLEEIRQRPPIIIPQSPMVEGQNVEIIIAPWTDDDLQGTIQSEVQYGLMLDCEKNGCDPRHADHGHVDLRRLGGIWVQHQLDEANIQGHAATIIKRTVTYSPWEPVVATGAINE